MKLTLAAWRTTRQPPPLRLEHLTGPQYTPLIRDEDRPSMRGPVDPAHDPCGRPPLPPAEVNHD